RDRLRAGGKCRGIHQVICTKRGGMRADRPDLPLSGDRRFGVSPSFLDALGEHGPEPLRTHPTAQPSGQLSIPHGTTVIGLLFDGDDERRGEGRLFRYDATGGRWEEEDYMSTGSGGKPARSTLKKRWRAGLSRDEAVRLAVEALVDASEEDVATGGPDPARGI